MPAGYRDLPLILGLWLVLTACNLAKPFQIDDGAHLLIAQWIASGHWAHPMSGIMNWDGIDEPIWHTNQPHLYFYLLALWGRAFGWSEYALHGLQALLVLPAIVFFTRLARRLVPGHAAWLTALFCLSPAMLVGQNLMLEVPLVGLWLGFFDALLIGRRYTTAALFCAAALLVKYSSLVLLVILIAALVIDKRRKQAWTVLIPLAVLLAWSLFNLWDYGGIHILSRPLADNKPALLRLFKPLSMLAGWVAALGAVMPLGFFIGASRVRAPRARHIAYALPIAGIAALGCAVAWGWIGDRVSDGLLQIAFLANAAIMIGLPRPALASLHLDRTRLLLGLWLAGACAFNVLFAPFMAVRHVLLALPPLLLLIGMTVPVPKPARWLSLLCVVLLSAGLEASDWRFAAFYRDEAHLLARHRQPGQRLWTSGHWAWQWYAQREGITQFDVRRWPARRGDLVAILANGRYQVPGNAPMHLLREDRERASWLPFCTGRPASFYFSDLLIPSWSFSRNCRAGIALYQAD